MIKSQELNKPISLLININDNNIDTFIADFGKMKEITRDNVKKL